MVSLANGALDYGGSYSAVAVDVKNTFNPANWWRIESALTNIGVPEYLVSLVENYLSEGTLWYGTNEDPKMYVVTVGVPKGRMHNLQPDF